jgi:hypothetical protein
MSVSCECCVLLGALCHGPILRPKETTVCVCVARASARVRAIECDKVHQ